MKEEKRPAKLASGRGTYARQACNHCRRRKSKCDGQQPVCGPCRDSGRADECTWGRETAKKARTQQHFEALVNHIKSLETRVRELESELTKTKRRSYVSGAGSGSGSGEGSRSEATATPSVAGSASLSPGPGPRMSPVAAKFEEEDEDAYGAGVGDLELEDERDKWRLNDEEEEGDEKKPGTGNGNGTGNGSDQEDSEIEQLIAPTRHLVLQGNDLEFYGPTSAYRLAPERTRPGPGTSNGNGLSSKSNLGHTGTQIQPMNAITNNNNAVGSSNAVGVESSRFEWDRYLPREAPLSRAEHDRLLDLLFRFCTSWCFRIIPSLFWRDMHTALSLPPSSPLPKSAHYSPLLHNALLALATTYSDEEAVRHVEFRRHFAMRAKGYVERDCMAPSVCLVSGLSLLSTFHSSRGEQSLGYLYAGMAGRMTQALGLQIDCSSLVKLGRITESDMHERNWVYWTTFCQDVCWSLYIGRDCALKQPSEAHLIPVPYVDSEYDREPWVWPPSGLPPQKSNVASVFAATCSLLRIARRIMDFVNGLTTNFRHPNLQIVSELDIELNSWKDGLSPEVDLTAATRPSALPHRLSVHLMFWWLFILLHRPFYRRTKAVGDIDHVKLCNRAAENMMLLLNIWKTNYDLRYVSTTHIQFVFSAGTVFVLSAIQAISGPRLGRVTLTSSLAQIKECGKCLTAMSVSWETALLAKEILMNFFDEKLRPRLQLRGASDELVKFEPDEEREREREMKMRKELEWTQGREKKAGYEKDWRRDSNNGRDTRSFIKAESPEPQSLMSPASAASASTFFTNQAVPPISTTAQASTQSHSHALRAWPAAAFHPQHAHGLGWPPPAALSTIDHDPSRAGPSKFDLQYHMTLPSPQVEHHTPRFIGVSQEASDALAAAMDLDFAADGFPELASSSSTTVVPVHPGYIPPHPATAHLPSFDALSFGVPEVPEHGHGHAHEREHEHGREREEYDFDPRNAMELDFSAEELALMDQIVRQGMSGITTAEMLGEVYSEEFRRVREGAQQQQQRK